MHWLRLTPWLAVLGGALFACSLDDRAVQTTTGDASSDLAVLGAACSDGAECALGFCADGVCCESACDQLCEQCSAAGRCEVPSDDLDCPVVTCPASDVCRSYAGALNEDRCASRGQCKTAADCVPTLGTPNQLCSDSSQATESRCDAQGVCVDTGVALGGNCEAGCVDACELCTSASVCEVPPTDSRCPAVDCSQRTSTCGSFSASSITSANLCRELGTCKTLDDCELIANPGLPALTAPSIVSPFRGAYSGSLHAPASAQTLRPRFEWSAVDSPCGGVSYQLQVDDSCEPGNLANCGFASVELDTQTNQTFLQPSEDLPVSSAAPVGAYYAFRVRACDDSGRCSAYSEPGYLHVGRTRHDVNGDGFADVVVAATSAEAIQGLDVFFGSSQFNVARDLRVDTTLRNPRFVGDLDADGFEDLAGTISDFPDPPCGVVLGGLVIRVLFGATDLNAARISDLCSTQGSPSVSIEPGFIGDLDGEGHADLGVARGFGSANNLLVFSGGAELGVSAFVDVVPGLFPYALTSNKRQFDGGGDFNRDGYGDVIVTESFRDDDTSAGIPTVDLLLGAPVSFRSTFDASVSYPLCSSRGWVAFVGDTNQDSFGDWAVQCTDSGSRLGLLRGNAVGQLAVAELLSTPLSLTSASPVFDFDNDETAELFVGVEDSSPVVLDPANPVTDPLSRFTNMGSATQLQAADHNGNNRLDLVVGSIANDSIVWAGSSTSFNVTPLPLPASGGTSRTLAY